MKRKTVAIVLSTMLAISALGGCGSSTPANVETEKTQESQKAGGEGAAQTEGLVPITFVRSQDSTIESSVFAKMEGSTYEDNIWTDLIADTLGYEVKYLWIASDGDLYKQKFNAAISSGEIPDIASVGKEDLKRLVDADLIVDLKPYIDEYASDYVKQLYETVGESAFDAVTYNGAVYGLPISDSDIERAQILWLRQDWLDALGLSAPASIDELKEVLRAFKDYAGEGGVGLAMGNDLYGNQFDIKGICNAYHAYPTYWIEDKDGSLVYGSTTPEMKKALTTLSELYADGLIDNEFYVNDNQKAAEALVNGKCGAMYGFHATPLDFLQTVKNANPEAEWKPFMIPMEKADEKAAPGIEMATTGWYVVSKNCEHPEALIQLMNLYCEKVLDPEKNEYTVYANPGNGVEGVWKLAPVGITSTPDKNQATTKAIAEPLKTGEPGDLTGEQYSMWEYCYKALQGDDSMWGWLGVFGEEGGQSILLKYQDPENATPVYNKFVSAPGEVMTARKSTLDDMLDQTFLKIISGQEKIDAFDKVVEEWKNAGGIEMTAEVNEWYSSNK